MITMIYLTPATGVPPLVLADGTDETVSRRRDGPFHVVALAGEEIGRCRQLRRATQKSREFAADVAYTDNSSRRS